MANRFLNPLNYTFEKATVGIYGDVTIGAAGAPTLVPANSKGIKSIVRNSAGDYTVTFADQYNKFLSFWVGFRRAAGSAPAAPTMVVKTVSPVAAGGATLEFILFNSAGAATDPANGEELYIEATFGNTAAF